MFAWELFFKVWIITYKLTPETYLVKTDSSWSVYMGLWCFLCFNSSLWQVSLLLVTTC